MPPWKLSSDATFTIFPGRPARQQVPPIARDSAEDGVQVDLEHGLPVLVGELLRRAAADDPGVVDQDVEPARGRDRAVHAGRATPAGSPRSAVIGNARRPAASTARQVSSGERELPCTTTSAPASARPTAIAAPRPREAPGDERDASFEGERLHWPLPAQEVLAYGRKDVQQDHLLVEHGRTVPDSGGEVQDRPRPHLALLVADREERRGPSPRRSSARADGRAAS